MLETEEGGGAPPRVSKIVPPITQAHLVLSGGSLRDQPPQRETPGTTAPPSRTRPPSPQTPALRTRTVRSQFCRGASKLEQAAGNPPPLRWTGPEQPALWTDVVAEMSRHIYIRNKIGEGIQAPIFHVSYRRRYFLTLANVS